MTSSSSSFSYHATQPIQNPCTYTHTHYCCLPTLVGRLADNLWRDHHHALFEFFLHVV